MNKELYTHRIVFFDGVCGLCNRAIDFLIRHDKRKVLKFAALQGETASELLTQDDRTSLSTMIYYSNGKTFYRTAAILNLLWDMGGYWKLWSIFRIVPAFIRDIFYGWLSSSRYRWFGQKESCRIPTPEERERFLN